ncbi:hypothetical protein L1987_83509 [Smallanthus sonchifolius]|uniref:Uncharacterized protein n=1 Tax=Smallanthus sonchifolius TaxID=185202 RepID=A0ACB8YCU7_9ASTR|nr:hypothetical protein L1987_83509 [Smallanthus sonchifolius]
MIGSRCRNHFCSIPDSVRRIASSQRDCDRFFTFFICFLRIFIGNLKFYELFLNYERAMNAPDRYERFVVPEGTKKVSYERDTKIINAASFTIEREDHTIGNIVRMQLHRDGNVLFAGYKLPHPLQYKIIVRVHTTSQSSPMQAYNLAINDLDKELDHLKAVFEAEVARVSGEY